jgi:hypothetical protein
MPALAPHQFKGYLSFIAGSPPAAIRKRCAMKREIRIDKIEIDAMISRKTPFPPVSRLIMGYVSGVLKKMMPNRVT